MRKRYKHACANDTNTHAQTIQTRTYARTEFLNRLLFESRNTERSEKN